MCLKVFRHQPLGCYFEKSRDLSGTGMVCISLGGCINLPELKAQLLFCIQISIECKDFDLDKTLILQNNIILRVIKTCINKGGVCAGKLVLLLLPLSPPPFPLTHPLLMSLLQLHRSRLLSDAVTCITKQPWSSIISEPSEVLTDVLESQRRCSMRAAEATRD